MSTHDLDGCDLDFTSDDIVTEDGEQVAALVLFADINFTNPAAVAARVTEWEALADGL